MNVTGSVALVTGANGGIGRVLVAALLAAKAAKIYAATRDPGATAVPGTVPLKLDVTKPEEVAAAVRAAPDVRLLINNAGGNFNTPLLKIGSTDNARTEMEVNYFGTLAMCRAFAPVLARNGGGVIVNMLSILARVNLPLMGSLCASKAAALSLTQGVRAELAKQGTRVIGVLPGAVRTRMTEGIEVPKIEPEEVVAAILAALAGDDEEIYPGEMASGVKAGLAADPKGVEKQFGTFLPP
jgi:NAD(P)-dependent dehydrogenase (short-subunit alcohol dehydrogenase family)